MILAGNPNDLADAMRGLVKRKRGRAEEKIQEAVVAQIEARKHRDVVWWHVPNSSKLGGRRTKDGVPFAAIRNKKLGVKAGVSDLHFVYRGRFYVLELKAEGGRATEPQMQFIAEGFDQAIRTLESWGLLKGQSWGA